jgi:hypothetical protein
MLTELALCQLSDRLREVETLRGEVERLKNESASRAELLELRQEVNSVQVWAERCCGYKFFVCGHVQNEGEGLCPIAAG